MIRRQSLWAATACGMALGLGGIVLIDAATESADAQARFTVSAEQLQINQRISQAAVRRSNRSLNYLAPIRTQATDAADDGTKGVTALARVAGAGQGWTTPQLADAAVTSPKIAAGAVGTAEVADGAVTLPKLDPAAVNQLRSRSLNVESSSGWTVPDANVVTIVPPQTLAGAGGGFEWVMTASLEATPVLDGTVLECLFTDGAGTGIGSSSRLRLTGSDSQTVTMMATKSATDTRARVDLSCARGFPGALGPVTISQARIAVVAVPAAP